MIGLIIGSLLVIFGLFIAIKPDNPFLPYLDYYSRGFVIQKGGLAKEHIKKHSKTAGLLLWMRIMGIVMVFVGILFLIAQFS